MTFRFMKHTHYRTYFTIIGVLVIVFLCVFPDIVFAQSSGTVISVPLEVGIGTDKKVTGLTDYIGKIYKFTIGAIGIASAVMIMINGLRWAAASGNSEQIGQAKEGVTSAIIGLVIALSSYLILFTLNPALVSLGGPTFSSPVSPESASSSTAATTQPPTEATKCQSNSSLIDFNKEGVIPKEYKKYFWPKTTQMCADQATTQALIQALGTIASAPAGSDYYGMKLYVTSAYRGGDAGTHGKGQAMDIGWSPDFGGKYPSTTSYMGQDHLDWNNNCICNTKDDSRCTESYRGASNCTQKMQDSVYAMNKLLQSSGFGTLCVEWWHHQTAFKDSSNPVCALGVHKYFNKK